MLVEIPEEILELSRELNTQDNRSTADPIFVQIQTTELVENENGDKTRFVNNDYTESWSEEEFVEYLKSYYNDNIDSDEKATKKIIDKIAQWVLEDAMAYIGISFDLEEIADDLGFHYSLYQDENKYHNAFLTIKACEDHIKRNAYHYNSPVSYVSHAFRNPELEMVLKFLKSLTNGEK